MRRVKDVGLIGGDMERFALRVLLVGAVIALGVAPAAVAKPAPPGDFARGSGESAYGSTFSFSATAGVNGGTATGTMFESGPTHTVRGEVRCLTVTGNRATVKGVATESDVPAGGTGEVGATMYFVVEDRAKKGAGVDRFQGFYGNFEDPCIADFTGVEVPPIVSGDIVVQDCVALSKNGKHCAKSKSR